MDYNFFESVKKQRTKSNPITLVLLAATTAFLGLFVLLIAYTIWNNHSMQQEIDRIKDDMSTEAYLAAQAEAEQIQTELNKLNNDVEYLEWFTQYADASHTVNKDLLDTLKQAIPRRLSFINVTIEDHAMKISGEGNDLITIAQFEYNLRQTALFEGPIISTINEVKQLTTTGATSRTYYQFNLELTIKGTEYPAVSVPAEGEEAAAEGEADGNNEAAGTADDQNGGEVE